MILILRNKTEYTFRKQRMVAINDVDPTSSRRQVLLEGSWPEYLERLATNHCTLIKVGADDRDALVTFFGDGGRVTGQQKQNLADYLISLTSDIFLEWLEEVIARFLDGELDRNWFRATEIVQQLEARCRLRVTAIFNFSGFGNNGSRDIPTGEPYPFAFVVTGL